MIEHEETAEGNFQSKHTWALCKLEQRFETVQFRMA